MADHSVPTVEGADEREQTDESECKPPWPLSFKMHLPQPGAAGASTASKPLYWSHRFYRGPENKAIQVLYSKTKAESERIAKLFLNETLIGFDMEWPWDDWRRYTLQEKIGLIQVACEDKIGLFHIGLHPGNTVDDLIAPSLRKLIECPNIVKVGVNIVRADFGRINKHFGLQPTSAFELSHLYHLVTHGPTDPNKCTTELLNMAAQVKKHLGLPLYKGDVRTSNWSRSLNEEQIKYAADDAYAGYMLYYCMNAKRKALKPSPPLPRLADAYKWGRYSRLQLCPLTAGGTIIMADEFFRPKEAKRTNTKEAKKKDIKEAKKTGVANEAKQETQAVTSKTEKKDSKKLSPANTPLDATSQLLYSQLSGRRMKLAKEQNVAPFIVATNALLRDVAYHKPINNDTLLRIRGVGRKTASAYGKDWLEVTSSFLTTQKALPTERPPLPETETAETETAETKTAERQPEPPPPMTPTRSPRRTEKIAEPASESSPAFATPAHRIGLLSTGLSFSMTETSLKDDGRASDGGSTSEASDESEAFATPLSRPVSRLKRKRSTSPVRADFTPRSKVYRNKLQAFSRLVTSKMEVRPADAQPIVSDDTLNYIVSKTPKTLEELRDVPGIEPWLQACKDTQMDLLKNILKFAPVRF